VPRHERRLEPLEREHARSRPAADTRPDGRDAPLDLAHALICALRHPAGPPDQANRAEHASDVMGVERQDRRAGGEARGGGRCLVRRHCTDLAHSLREQQVGLDGGQPLSIDLVDAAELPEGLPHDGVDLAARAPVERETRPGQARFGPHLGRVVAAVRDAHDAIAQPQRVSDLGRAGEK
jgi:hypothetical protein